MPRYVNIPGVGEYKFPDGTSDEAIYLVVDRIVSEKNAPYLDLLPDYTLAPPVDPVEPVIPEPIPEEVTPEPVEEPEPEEPGVVSDIFGGLKEGFVRSLETGVVGASALLPEETEKAIVETVGDVSDYLAPEPEEGDPEASVTRKLFNAVGSMLTFLGPGLAVRGVAAAVGAGVTATRVAGLGTSGLFGSAIGAGEARQRAIAEGATPEQTETSTQLGALVGVSEILPVQKLFTALDPKTLKGITDYVKSAFTTGSFEAAQEAAANVAQNLIAKGIYKPSQELIEGAGEAAAYGGGAGAIIQVVMDLALGRRARVGSADADQTDSSDQRELLPDTEESLIEEARELVDTGDIDVGRGIDAIATDLGIPLTDGDKLKSRARKLKDLADKIEEYERTPPAEEDSGSTVAEQNAIAAFNEAQKNYSDNPTAENKKILDDVTELIVNLDKKAEQSQTPVEVDPEQMGLSFEDLKKRTPGVYEQNINNVRPLVESIIEAESKGDIVELNSEQRDLLNNFPSEAREAELDIKFGGTPDRAPTLTTEEADARTAVLEVDAETKSEPIKFTPVVSNVSGMASKKVNSKFTAGGNDYVIMKIKLDGNNQERIIYDVKKAEAYRQKLIEAGEKAAAKKESNKDRKVYESIRKNNLEDLKTGSLDQIVSDLHAIKQKRTKLIGKELSGLHNSVLAKENNPIVDTGKSLDQYSGTRGLTGSKKSRDKVAQEWVQNNMAAKDTEDALVDRAVDYYDKEKTLRERSGQPEKAKLKTLKVINIQKDLKLKPKDLKAQGIKLAAVKDKVFDRIADKSYTAVRRQFYNKSGVKKRDILNAFPSLSDGVATRVFRKLKQEQSAPKPTVKTTPSAVAQFTPTQRGTRTSGKIDVTEEDVREVERIQKEIESNTDRNSTVGKIVRKLKPNSLRLYLSTVANFDHIADIWRLELPVLSRIQLAIQSYNGDLRSYINDAEYVSEQISDFNLDNTKNNKYEKLGELLRASTYTNTAVYKVLDGTQAKPKEGYDNLKKLYDDIGLEGQRVYRLIGEHFSGRYNQLVASLRARLDKLGVTDQQIEGSPQLKEVLSGIPELNFYWPLKRRGKFWITFTSMTDKPVAISYSDENTWEAASKYLQKMEEKGEISGVNSFVGSYSNLHSSKNNVMDTQKAKELQVSLSKALDSIGLESEQKDAAIKSISEDMVEFYANNSPESHIMKGLSIDRRKNILGADGDVLNVFTNNAVSLAQQLARFNSTQELDVGLARLEEQVRRGKDLATKSEYRMVKDTTEDFIRDLKTPPLDGFWRATHNNIGRFGFLWYLASPAAAVNNLVQIPTYSASFIQQKFGWANAYKALFQAALDLRPKLIGNNRDLKRIKYTYTDRNGETATGYERMPTSKNITKDEKKAMVRGYRDDYIGRTQTGDVGGFSIEDLQGKDFDPTKYSITRRRSLKAKLNPLNLPHNILTFFGHLFSSAERFNREVTFLAAYRLASKTPSKLKSGVKHSTPYAYAANITNRSQGNYSQTNSGKWFRGHGKSILMFKKYPVLMMANYAEAIRRSEILPKIIPGRKSNKFSKEEQKEATKLLFGMLGTSLITAGVYGLPLWWAFVGVAEVAMLLLADEEEGEIPIADVDLYVRNYLEDALGFDVYGGVLEAALGISVGERLGVGGDLFYPPRTTRDMNLLWQAAEMFGGPAVAATTGVLKSFEELVFEDDPRKSTLRKLESALPTVIKNQFQAYRLSTEGLTNPTGKVIDENITKWEVFAESLGYTSKDITRLYDLRSATTKDKERIRKYRNTITGAIQDSMSRQNVDDIEKLYKRAAKFNRIYVPKYDVKPIRYKDILNTYKRNEKSKFQNMEKDNLGIDPRGFYTLDKLKDRYD